MKRYVLIVAGGKGLRMGGDLPKQFIPLQGRPVLMHTLERFYQWDASVSLVLVLPEDHQPYWNMLCKELDCCISHQIVSGGETRFHSVQNGLSLVEEGGLVAVHDGVRPFVSLQVIEDCFAEAALKGAAVPVVPIVDSIRKIGEDVTSSHPVNREQYKAVQTPQVFQSEILLKAYRQPYTPAFTDDASVVEVMGIPVSLVAGNPENIKITTPFDLLIAEAYAISADGKARN
ncbi:2-C-methyl-D-erythritol 4-phosphate cytidylyltransferase [Parabacteroides sp. PF5-5]|uniref:2-C-methyl-D-erythritol 4-phosphate cytidylyltransferase n=1 Tax=unclassified Parabacteroides TaxID=2649774 RepID=UPI0024766B59|nr:MULTISPECIES: 2-C-methyl-D-erythritol 4-phosphate cytidylyltransferase [unclassified Parabacteroides]MDH6303441.1 2-C-methyl-D-erythritol 4-phosphate cytidylyltransferase [Parabacteroides sp. PH5-39]MDH6314764.1 2-C-methyl-D-erythritol 4-phosphate cytidylyltransferase [Parabacteroides sp. PF5-13]MDH6318101.1 2-C-methyl-D-erythritol 4-phosphate cytidylyltransferase [Parabacteroides sp. PH5-13]MDH6321968.1 2-C-methyl-D-erythritol 4-phosphate cytidylyltransferase [Parabacteroides sp. PH5-8]MDH